MKNITIVCDGSSLGNGGVRPRAAACAVLGYKGYWQAFAKYLGEATNQQAEIAAATLGLNQLSEGCKVHLYSDSRYVVQTMLGNFKKKTNHDWWQELEAARTTHTITWEWVKGHAGHAVQEVADDIARHTAEVGKIDESFIDEAVLHLGTEEY